mmetsp:Transcript_44369/g.87657  ORF Transcript_44369/g.87657 Transcript_44369/m.87657 type:complete len:247 (-) Transcript_44369:1102-1842(-)
MIHAAALRTAGATVECKVKPRPSSFFPAPPPAAASLPASTGSISRQHSSTAEDLTAGTLIQTSTSCLAVSLSFFAMASPLSRSTRPGDAPPRADPPCRFLAMSARVTRYQQKSSTRRYWSLPPIDNTASMNCSEEAPVAAPPPLQLIVFLLQLRSLETMSGKLEGVASRRSIWRATVRIDPSSSSTNVNTCLCISGKICFTFTLSHPPSFSDAPPSDGGAYTRRTTSSSARRPKYRKFLSRDSTKP